jgi:plastocyanin
MVAMYDNYFRPRRISIPRGGRVRWVNRGEVPHTTTGRGWDVTLEPGETFTKRFRRAGTYRYVCRFHPGMTGRVIVG